MANKHFRNRKHRCRPRSNKRLQLSCVSPCKHGPSSSSTRPVPGLPGAGVRTRRAQRNHVTATGNGERERNGRGADTRANRRKHKAASVAGARGRGRGPRRRKRNTPPQQTRHGPSPEQKNGPSGTEKQRAQRGPPRHRRPRPGRGLHTAGPGGRRRLHLQRARLSREQQSRKSPLGDDGQLARRAS